MRRRAVYLTDSEVMHPADGMIGWASPAKGCNDTGSAEFGAWTFDPDGEPPRAYYCDPHTDLQLLPEGVPAAREGDWTPPIRFNC